MRPFSLFPWFLGFRSPEYPLPSPSSVVFPIRILALSYFAFFLAAASPLRAETDIQFGPFALNGADGATGIPGQPGQNGGPGGSAIATADARNQNNIAEATGAGGGNGGAGGDATIGSGADGGQGGNGGNGGNATATATTIARDSARAVATGGLGGSASSGGNGSLAGMDGLSGDFGRQGNAIAQASIDRESLIVGTSAGIQGDAVADGGNASATVSGIVGGVASPTASHRLEAVASSLTGNAAADAMGRTNHGDMIVRADAFIDSGSDLTDDVSANATGTHSGAGSLLVTATSTIRQRRGLLATQVGHASASGVATGGGDVTVEASVLGGTGIEVRDAVSGSTSGLLRLSQDAHSSIDRPGFQQSVAGRGEVRTSLSAENSGGGDLEMFIGASGVSAFPEIAGEGDVVLGDIHGLSNSGADVSIDVLARAYRVLQQDLDDASQPSQIRGTSNGGDVSISAEFQTGFRTLTLPLVIGTEVIGRDGSDVVIDQGLGGDTTGNLEFVVSGRAGNGGSVNLAPGVGPPGATHHAGDGGNFITRLTQSGSYASLSMNATSFAGFGGSNGVPSSTTRGGRGGSATMALDGTNDAGNVTLIGNARGTRGGQAINRTGQGGDATIDFRATTSGDGNDILIGNATEQEVTFPITVTLHGAHAGDGGRAAFDPSHSGRTPSEFGAGGVANSQSNGLALGDSTVTVYDFAGGGDSSGLGGDASSSARAEGSGISSVLAQSKAAGGHGSNGGGNADSFAFASGLGQSDASALAISDGGPNQARTAHAIAEATGTSGSVTAEARGGDSNGFFTTMLSRSTSSLTRLEATVGTGLALPTPSIANSGSAFLTGRPLSPDIDQFALGNDALGDLFTANPGVQVQAIGGWDARGDDDAASTQLVELDITLGEPASGGDLALVFSNSSATGGGFESLLFRLEILGTIFGEEVIFGDLAEAVNFFSSALLLGESYRGIRAIFEVATLPGQSVAFGLAAVIVPEPSTALLLGVGLMLVATSRRQKHSTPAATG